jgi:hypothetical protein
MDGDTVREWLLIFAIVLVCILPVSAYEPVEDPVCVTYFTGVGCSNCAEVDPYILDVWLKEYPSLVVIEYEIYQHPENGQVLDRYVDQYNAKFGFPLILLGEDSYFIGKRQIISKTPEYLSGNGSLQPGNTFDMDDLDLLSLPGSPQIWHQDRILIKRGPGGNNTLLKCLLTGDDIEKTLEGSAFTIVRPEPVAVSGNTIEFSHAVNLGNWLFQYNDGTFPVSENPVTAIEYSGENAPVPNTLRAPTVAKIVSLAVVDAINPCALAVLLLVLLSVLTAYPTDKNKVLWAGFAFSAAIFIVYLFYGLVIVHTFQILQSLGPIRLVLTKLVAIGAVLLGLLHIHDFFSQKKGGLFREMPASVKPKVRNLLAGITSPCGAFIAGSLVSVFLLPCTIGPYVIAGGILSLSDMVSTIPFLLLYNLIFIIPMLGVTILIYSGMMEARDVAGWKTRNVRYIRLISGMIILIIGLVMLLGFL